MLSMVTRKFSGIRWCRYHWVPCACYGTMRYQRGQGEVMARTETSKRPREGGDETAVRARILEAAFAAFMKSGYAAASTLEIATRARVSKRELYKLVGNKQEMLIACISERAKGIYVPASLPVLRHREVSDPK